MGRMSVGENKMEVDECMWGYEGVKNFDEGLDGKKWGLEMKVMVVVGEWEGEEVERERGREKSVKERNDRVR